MQLICLCDQKLPACRGCGAISVLARPETPRPDSHLPAGVESGEIRLLAIESSSVARGGQGVAGIPGAAWQHGVERRAGATSIISALTRGRLYQHPGLPIWSAGWRGRRKFQPMGGRWRRLRLRHVSFVVTRALVSSERCEFPARAGYGAAGSPARFRTSPRVPSR